MRLINCMTHRRKQHKDWIKQIIEDMNKIVSVNRDVFYTLVLDELKTDAYKMLEFCEKRIDLTGIEVDELIVNIEDGGRLLVQQNEYEKSLIPDLVLITTKDK